jgi:hypothetical protein
LLRGVHEINARRSKALHISNVTRMTLQKGAVDDVETTRREGARPDGVVEYNADSKNRSLRTRRATCRRSWNCSRTPATKSIRLPISRRPCCRARTRRRMLTQAFAINLLQKAGIAEIGTFLRNYRAWKIRVYRAI